jgi:hypothetical protein
VAVAAAAVAVTLALELLLFQKKAFVVALVMMGAAWLVDRWRRHPGTLRVAVPAGCAVLVALFLALVVTPVYLDSKKTLGDAQETAGAGSRGLLEEHELAGLAREIGIGDDRTRTLLLYALLSPLTRTSIPALAYVEVYPKVHGYHTLDLGQDVLGVGTMPDDNLVVWRYLNGDTYGTTAAPAQFVLYSQGGIAVAIIGSVVLGIALALLWRAARSLLPPWSPLASAVVIVLAAYLAIDSPRNSILVSYGVVWGFVFLACAAIGIHAAGAARQLPRRAGDPAQTRS